MLIDFRERMEKVEKNTDVRNINQLSPICTQPGIESTTSYEP